jgi:hypothetical protein
VNLLGRLLHAHSAHDNHQTTPVEASGDGCLTRAAAPPIGKATHLVALVSMTLEQFAHEGSLLEVGVPWLTTTLWFVPGDREVETLVMEGITRGRIWTANELAELLALPTRVPEMVRTVAHAKLEMAGEILDTRTSRGGVPRAADGPAKT